MDIYAVLNIILPIVLIAIGIALVVFIIELIKMVKVTRGMVSDMKVQLDPTMANIKEMTDSLKPAVEKADPIAERLVLTLDAVNLELMRVDEILEDVSQISDSAASASEAVDNLASAPVKAVNNVTSRVRAAFHSKHASAESSRLSDKKRDDDAAQALKDYQAAEAAEEAATVATPAAASAKEVPAAKEAAAAADELDKQPTGPIPVDEIRARLEESASDGQAPAEE